MPFDDGINWGGGPGANGVNIEVEAASTPTTGVIRVGIMSGDTPETLAARAATEWNARQPITGVFAISGPGSKVTRFLHPGGQILGIAVTFDDTTRVALDIGQTASSVKGAWSIQRTQVTVP